MKDIYILLFAAFFVLPASAQGYNADKTAFTNFLVRMYKSAPFDGVRIVSDYDHPYLVSALALAPEKYNDNESVINRVAEVKSTAQVSRFLNGSNITQDMVIHTTERADGQHDVDIIEEIRENSIGYVKALEQLTSFKRDDGKMVFIFISKHNGN